MAPKICSSSTTRAGNTLLAVGNVFGGMFGFAKKTPLEKLHEDIAETRGETQQIISDGTEEFAKLQGEFNGQILRNISLVNSTLQQYVNIQDEILSQNIIINKIYIYGSYILSLCIIVSLYFTKSFLR